jgi:hypothetical protein
MKNRIATIVIAAAALVMAGCFATQTSGPTVSGTQAGSQLSVVIGQNVLMDDPTVLQIYATTDCNVAAAQEFRLSIMACEGQLAALAGGAIIPANVVTGINDACQFLGYTNSANQLLPGLPTTVTPGPASACLQPAAKISAPLGEPLKPLMPPLVKLPFGYAFSSFSSTVAPH